MKIAVISDTHNLFRPEVREIISKCDGVVHAGDVNSQKVLDEIKASVGIEVPFYVVRGNNDREWARDLPKTTRFAFEGVKFFLVHDKKDVLKDLDDVQVVIYGHSHKYAEEFVDGKLWLNPGSCGKRRFRSAVTMAVLHLEEIVCRENEHIKNFSGQFGEIAWRVEKIELEVAVDLAKQADFSEGKLVGIVTEIFERMDKGQTISYIARKVRMEEELVEQICRIRVTHPGVTPGGVVDKMEVNRVVIKSSK